MSFIKVQVRLSEKSLKTTRMIVPCRVAVPALDIILNTNLPKYEREHVDKLKLPTVSD